jgi:hypothetical protein
MAQYRYLFADLRTNNILAELPITNVNFTNTLNASGTLSANILLSGASAAKQNVQAATIPARTAIYVDRDGVLVWGGIIWSREYNSSSQQMSITAQTFDSYFNRRRITQTKVFLNTDQFTIAQYLVTTAQSTVGGNIGVIVPTTTSGRTVSRTYYNYEQKTVLAALQDLSKAGAANNTLPGFDFSFDVAYNGAGFPTKTFNLRYPRAGTTYSAANASAPVLQFPAGNILEYNYLEDGSLTANYVYISGGGSNEGKLLNGVSNTSLITASGWPMLEDNYNYGDMVSSAQLTNLGQGHLAAIQSPPVTLTVTVPPYVSPILGSYVIGDDFRIMITDERFPTGLDQTYRLIALNVTPGEAGPERATLTFSLPTS